MVNDIDTTAIRAWADAHEAQHNGAGYAVWTFALCDALDAARLRIAELEEQRKGDFLNQRARAEAAEAELEERWTLVRQRDDAMAERDQSTDRADAAEARADASEAHLEAMMIDRGAQAEYAFEEACAAIIAEARIAAAVHVYESHVLDAHLGRKTAQHMYHHLTGGDQ